MRRSMPCSGARGAWLVRARDSDPFMPAVRIVAVLEEPTGQGMRSETVVRFDPNKTRAEINNVDWRSDLLEVARLLDHLSPPDHRDPERYFEQARR